jgi:hypothetical protein
VAAVRDPQHSMDASTGVASTGAHCRACNGWQATPLGVSANVLLFCLPACPARPTCLRLCGTQA